MTPAPTSGRAALDVSLGEIAVEARFPAAAGTAGSRASPRRREKAP